MFTSFEHAADTATARRLGASLAMSALICAGLMLAVMTAKLAPSVAEPDEPKVDVVFRPPPPVEAPPLPPPPKPVAKVAPKPAAPAAMVAPKEIVKEVPVEKPVDKPVEARELAVGGTGDGSSKTTVVAKVEAPAEPEEEEVPKPVTAGPVQLPEDADPPEEMEGNVRPEFPESARATGTEGLVVLKIVVEKDGSVGKITTMKGDEPFLAAALAAVKTWKYTPAQLDGEAIAVFRIVKIPFRLKT
jgi:periplasmic protein TonB